MKKIIATLFAVGALTCMQAQQAAAPAQPNQPPAKANRPTPEQMAMRHSTHMQKTLGLTDDQKQKAYQAILTRTSAIQKIKDKYGPEGDKKAMHNEIKPVRTQFVQTMNGILTPEQKTKWDEHRKKMHESRVKRHQNDPNAPAPPKNEDPKKIADDEDGIDD